ncbi:ubiquitin-like small modifier protein 1 [uncultured Methanofollis sp.]|mgnify:CR=1 FL=1|uniref:ubiquitin-like small modifier protein 1 n=1 Tax=uncultured Methanofollis sp. TaxID=262500 RepID=UPI002624C901|nr:ubiquitin-like small modifier protein 1 [uncultured Methanofollis sp.]
MKVIVKAFATFRKILENEKEVECPEGTTIGGLVEMLIAERPALRDAIYAAPGVLQDHVTVLRNGRNVYFEKGLQTVVADRDVVSLFPPVGGG